MPTRTPLTYYGGKQRLAEQIIPLFPGHRVYLEPFAGGAAILFAKARAERETINDADGTVMRFWRALRDRPTELADAVAATPYARAEWLLSDDLLDVEDDVEAARRLLVNVDQSFSRSRSSWSPPSLLADRRGRWQAGVWENLPPKLIAAARRLRGVALECGDGVDMIPRWDTNDTLIYIDPPYIGEHRLTLSKGYRIDADEDLWPRLVETLASVRKAAVVLSGYPTAAVERLDWRRIDLNHKRTAQARAGGTLSVAPECVWLSPVVPDRLSLLA